MSLFGAAWTQLEGFNTQSFERSAGISYAVIVLYGQRLKHRKLMSCSQAKLPSVPTSQQQGLLTLLLAIMYRKASSQSTFHFKAQVLNCLPATFETRAAKAALLVTLALGVVGAGCEVPGRLPPSCVASAAAHLDELWPAARHQQSPAAS